MTPNEFTKSQWYQSAVTSCYMLSIELDLSEHHANKLQEYVLSVAKEQYRMGSRNGISWMRKQFVNNHA